MIDIDDISSVIIKTSHHFLLKAYNLKIEFLFTYRGRVIRVNSTKILFDILIIFLLVSTKNFLIFRIHALNLKLVNFAINGNFFK